jgi:hypothetical protein
MSCNCEKTLTSRKDTWTFSINSSELKLRLSERIKHHEDRLSHWKNLRDKKIEELKSTGITLEELNSEMIYSVSNSSRPMPHVKVDQKLTSEINECMAKIQEHEKKVKDFSSWQKTFDFQKEDSVFQLTHSDMLYFGFSL